MKKFLILFLVVITSLNSCSEKDNFDEKEIFLRVENISEKDFKDVTINSNTRIIYWFQEMDAGTASIFSKLENPEVIEMIRLAVENEYYELNNIPRNQLSNLVPGYYSFQIDISDDSEKIINFNLKFEENPELE